MTAQRGRLRGCLGVAGLAAHTHRLVSVGGQIDDGQSAVGQTQLRSGARQEGQDQCTLIVGAAMGDTLAHAREQLRVEVPLETRYSAHGRSSYRSRTSDGGQTLDAFTGRLPVLPWSGGYRRTGPAMPPVGRPLARQPALAALAAPAPGDRQLRCVLAARWPHRRRLGA